MALEGERGVRVWRGFPGKGIGDDLMNGIKEKHEKSSRERFSSQTLSFHLITLLVSPHST